MTSWATPLSMGFSREKYCSGSPFPSSGDLPNPGIKPRSPALQEDSLPSEPPGNPCRITIKWLDVLLPTFPPTALRQSFRQSCVSPHYLFSIHFFKGILILLLIRVLRLFNQQELVRDQMKNSCCAFLGRRLKK